MEKHFYILKILNFKVGIENELNFVGKKKHILSFSLLIEEKGPTLLINSMNILIKKV